MAIFGGGLLVFSVLRGKSGSNDDMDVRVSRSQTNMTDKPQVVQTVELTDAAILPADTEARTAAGGANQRSSKSSHRAATAGSQRATLAPISLVRLIRHGWSYRTRRSVSSIYAPFGRLISCETVVTVDSASIQTPIVGLVTENVYHAGKLVIPAGTEVHGTAQTDRHRERIASGNSWTLVWQTRRGTPSESASRSTVSFPATRRAGVSRTAAPDCAGASSSPTTWRT